MAEDRKFSWKSCLLIGCGVLLLIGIAVGVFVAANWQTISKTVGEATEVVTGLLDVQKAVRTATDAGEVRVHIDMSSDAKTLRVEIVGSKWLDDLAWESPEARAKALQAAVVARDALPTSTEYDRFQIEFVSQVSIGVTVKSSQKFDFAASDLPPRTAPAPR